MGKAGACDANIPYEYWLVSRLLHFWSQSLLMAQVFVPLLLLLKTQMKHLDPGFGVDFGNLGSKPVMENLFVNSFK